MAGAFGLGAVLLLPVLALHHDGLTQPGGIALALFLGIVPTALAYVLFARGLKQLSAAETATLTLAEPLTATLLGVIVLGETLRAARRRADPRRAARARRARGPPARYGPRVTTVDTVTDALRDEILSGERPAGARLVEAELTARYGVARHSLRAALRALQAEGLVQGRDQPRRPRRPSRRARHRAALRTADRAGGRGRAARARAPRRHASGPRRARDADPRLRGRHVGRHQPRPRGPAQRDRARRRSHPGSRPPTTRSTASCSCS